MRLRLQMEHRADRIEKAWHVQLLSLLQDAQRLQGHPDDGGNRMAEQLHIARLQRLPLVLGGLKQLVKLVEPGRVARLGVAQETAERRGEEPLAVELALGGEFV